MPTYEYQCTHGDCGLCFEATARMSDPNPLQGPGCRREDCSIQKKLTRVSAFVKGSGASKEQAKAALKDKEIVEKMGYGGPAVAYESQGNATPHVCTKYCGHHR